MDASTKKTKRSRIGLASLTVLAMGAGLVGLAGAQSGPTATCTGSAVTTFGSAFFGTEDHGNRLLSTGPISRDFALTSPLAAGTYALDAVSYDGYSTREVISPQPNEQWFIELLSEEGTVLATSGSTGDVADEVVEATWSGSIGEVTIDEPATAVRVRHATPGDSNVNSVRAICIGAEIVENAPPGSSVAVEFENTDDVATPVELDCGSSLVDGATGSTLALRVGDLDPSTTCTIDYWDGVADCEIAVTDNAEATGFEDDALWVEVPASGGVDIVVDIDCSTPTVVEGPTEPSEPETPEVVPTPTTVAPTVEPEVDSVTEVATPIDMNPSFTG